MHGSVERPDAQHDDCNGTRLLRPADSTCIRGRENVPVCSTHTPSPLGFSTLVGQRMMTEFQRGHQRVPCSLGTLPGAAQAIEFARYFEPTRVRQCTNAGAPGRKSWQACWASPSTWSGSRTRWRPSHMSTKTFACEFSFPGHPCVAKRPRQEQTVTRRRVPAAAVDGRPLRCSTSPPRAARRF